MNLNKKREREKELVSLMIRIYCRNKHGGKSLCRECAELEEYARDRSDKCPFIIGAFIAPPIAYWFMTPKAKSIMEESGISRKFTRKQLVSLTVLIAITCVIFIGLIIYAGKQGVSAGMSLLQLSIRYLIIFWMTSVFDAIVLDWWMFTRTRLFGIWLQKQTGTAPAVWSVDPQWDGKEIHKLLLEVVASAALAWMFLKLC